MPAEISLGFASAAKTPDSRPGHCACQYIDHRKEQIMVDKKPNILVMFGDDIGWFNISAYNHGLMGYCTPNIDRIAKEGAMFTDAYGQQSCTAGRAAFLTGQNPYINKVKSALTNRSITRNHLLGTKNFAIRYFIKLLNYGLRNDI